MLTVHSEDIGDVAIIECEGRIVRSEAAFKLRRAIMSHVSSHTIVLDLTEVHALEGGGLGMLAALQKWALDQGIQFKLFNPTSSVRNRLEHNHPAQFDVASFQEMLALLAAAEGQRAEAA